MKKTYSDNWTKAYLDDICHHNKNDIHILTVNSEFICSYSSKFDTYWTQLEKFEHLADDRLVSYADVNVVNSKTGITTQGRLAFAIDGVHDNEYLISKKGSFTLYLIDDFGKTVSMMNVVAISVD